MAIANSEIALVFSEIADLLDVQGANPFRIRAYRNAARTIEGLSKSVQTMVESGEDLDVLPSIGPDLASKIGEIVKTGTCALHERLRKELPPGITDLLKIPSLGPKRVMALHHDLGVQTIEQLHRAVRDGRVRTLAGFGEKTERNLREAIEAQSSKTKRFKLAFASQIAEPLLTHLKAVDGVDHAVVAGSFRRMRETVGDLDILVTANQPKQVIERFVAYDSVRKVLARGVTRASVILNAGIQVDLRVVAPASFGAALHYFTGSKAHSIAIRSLGQARGLKINEYGVFKGDKRVAGATEASVFESVGLPFIEPELREARGEIEAARLGRLPNFF